MKRKKIGVLIGDVMQNFASRICQAVSARAGEYGYDVYFFTMFGSYGDNILYAEGESKILSLPDYSKLDGVIIVPDSLYVPGGMDNLYKRLNEVSCPIVSVRDAMDGFYNIIVDETTSMERIIRHFIDVHKFRDICYMTGKMEAEDAQKRYKCYKRVMRECGIEVTENMVFYGDYWKNKGKEAVDHFLANRTDSYPEAIVCANDYMALSVCMELEERGIRVPEDICVSGFDDMIEAQQAVPSLTSVSVPFEELAQRAVDLIDEVDRGEHPPMKQYVPVIEKYRTSCGCKRHKTKNEWAGLVKQLESYKKITEQAIFMNADLEGVTDEKTLLSMVYKYNQNNSVKKIWVCLCDEEEELTEEEQNVGSMRIEYTQKMILRSVKTPLGSMRLMEKRFDRSELIPEEERSEIEAGSFYFVPLHYKNHNLGYVVFSYENCGHYSDFVRPWMMNFAVALENYRLHQNLNAMADIRRLYKEDALTGIPNRRGFEEQARKVYGDASTLRRRVAVISIDMDNLKKINDAYGHLAGDEALCRVAAAMEKVSDEYTAYARTGGDEFSVVKRIEKPGGGDDFIIRLREELQKINEQSDQPYASEVSCGVYEVENPSKTSLVQAMEMGDKHMYEDKKQRKAYRQD
ncbi:MAG: GGDEF domain-containing protein [Lachnospiraceae bacterium]|nr:GGDEF domain-containing protein [Lachnospiraceae bacterium]